MANKEPIAWITRNGKHIPIYEKGPTDEEKQKERQISQNQKEADKLNGKQAQDESKKYDDVPEVSTPESFEPYTKRLQNNSIEDIAWDFSKETGVHIDQDVVKSTNPETLCMAMDTIADIKNKYNCTILTIKNATDDMIEDSPNAYAWMGQDGCMYFNPKRFGKSHEQLQLDWAHGSSTKERGYHPPSPYGARTIIAHEMGHAIFNRYIENIMKVEDIREDFTAWSNHWNACHKFVTDKFANGERESYISSPGYKKLVDTFDKIKEEIRKEPYLLKRWGGDINLSLRGLADVRYGFGDAISEYAGTNYHEMIAEAFVDVYDNGKNASFTSKFLYNKIIKGMQK